MDNVSDYTLSDLTQWFREGSVISLGVTYDPFRHQFRAELVDCEGIPIAKHAESVEEALAEVFWTAHHTTERSRT